MIEDLDALSGKLAELNLRIGQMRDENRRLRTELAQAVAERDALRARVAQATGKIDALLARLPAEPDHTES
jgi:uncharacterized protein (TIGR02449 family)